MSLPGLGLSQPEEEARSVAISTVEHDIPRFSEWRFEVAEGDYVKLELLNGTAEIFGTELVTTQVYTFTNTKTSVYSWHGCTIRVSGDARQSEYMAVHTLEETPMSEYANVHFALETLRRERSAKGETGPRVLIVGSKHAGKTSLAKILTAYAIKVARQPIVVNLDTDEGMLGVAGTVSAAAFKTFLDVEDGWGNSPMSGPSAIPVKLPLAYYYGLSDPNEQDGQIYRSVISQLALAVASRLSSDPDAKEAGIIIDTPGAIAQAKAGSSPPYATIAHIVSDFSVDAILVLGSERLYSDLHRRFDTTTTTTTTTTVSPRPPITVLKITKSGGCVDRDPSYMKSLRTSQIRNYFFGNPKLTNGLNLSPHHETIDFHTLAIYRLIPADPASATTTTITADLFAPGGRDPDTETDFKNNNPSSSPSNLFTRLTSPPPAMTHSVLAVLNAAPPPPPHSDSSPSSSSDSSSSLLRSSVMGFIYVAEVDEVKGRITVLSPLPGRLPDRAIVWGGWPEAVVGLV